MFWDVVSCKGDDGTQWMNLDLLPGIFLFPETPLVNDKAKC